MTDEQYAAHRKMCDEFTKWREAEAKKLPELAARVFALRGRMYYGCGFHWSMECKLGTVIARLNDYDNGANYYGPEAMHYQIPLRVMVEELYERVDKAERSAGK